MQRLVYQDFLLTGRLSQGSQTMGVLQSQQGAQNWGPEDRMALVRALYYHSHTSTACGSLPAASITASKTASAWASRPHTGHTIKSMAILADAMLFPEMS